VAKPLPFIVRRKQFKSGVSLSFEGKKCKTARSTKEREAEEQRSFSDHPTGQNKREVQRSTLKISTYHILIFCVKRKRTYKSRNINPIVCLTTGP